MKNLTLVLLLLSLVTPDVALAESIRGWPTLDRFEMHVSPEYQCDCGETGFQKRRWDVAKGGLLRVWVNSERTDAQYRYVLEQRSGTQFVPVASSVWQSGIRDLEIDTAMSAITAGHYRLRVFARHPDVAELQERSATVRVIGPDHPNYLAARSASAVSANYVDAVMRARNALWDVKYKWTYGGSLASETALFSDEGLFISSLINQENRTAPGGGSAYIAGRGDDRTGAIGIELIGVPDGLGDWSSVMVRIDLPNYRNLDMDGDMERLEIFDDIVID